MPGAGPGLYSPCISDLLAGNEKGIADTRCPLRTAGPRGLIRILTADNVKPRSWWKECNHIHHTIAESCQLYIDQCITIWFYHSDWVVGCLSAWFALCMCAGPALDISDHLGGRGCYKKWHEMSYTIAISSLHPMTKCEVAANLQAWNWKFCFCCFFCLEASRPISHLWLPVVPGNTETVGCDLCHLRTRPTDASHDSWF